MNTSAIRSRNCYYPPPRQAGEIKFVKDLIRHVSETPSEDSDKQNSVQVKRPGKLRSLLALLRIRNPGERFSIATTLVLIAGVLLMIIWNLALQRKIGQIEARQAALEKMDRELRRQIDKQEDSREVIVKELEGERKRGDQLEQELLALQDFRPPGSTSDVAILDLGTGSFSRGGGELPVVRIPPSISRFQIRIGLDKDSYKSYSAVIKTFGGRETWSRDQIRPGRRLVLTPPASLFASDDYTLTLAGQTEAGGITELGDYSFRVKR